MAKTKKNTEKEESRTKKAPQKKTQLELDSKEKLLKVAAELFAASGLDGVSVREIAKKANLNLSLISYHFGGKEGLYKTILQEHMMKVQSQIEMTISGFKHLEMTKEVFKQEIYALVNLLVEARITDPHIAIILHRERLAGLPFARDLYEEVVIPMGEQLAGLVEVAQKKKIIRANLPARSFFLCLSESLWGYFTVADCHLTFTKECFQLPQNKEEFKKFLTELFTEGIWS